MDWVKLNIVLRVNEQLRRRAERVRGNQQQKQYRQRAKDGVHNGLRGDALFDRGNTSIERCFNVFHISVQHSDLGRSTLLLSCFAWRTSLCGLAH